VVLASPALATTGAQIGLGIAAARSPRVQAIYRMPAVQRYHPAAGIIDGIRTQHDPRPG